jgi:hypothetical protein
MADFSKILWFSFAKHPEPGEGRGAGLVWSLNPIKSSAFFKFLGSVSQIVVRILNPRERKLSLLGNRGLLVYEFLIRRNIILP